MSIPGTNYEPSGIFNVSKALVFTFIGCVIGIFAGWLYAVITNINPLIYLNFLLLIGAVFLLILINTLVKTWSKSRNRTVNVFISLVICVVTWYAHWAYYCDLSYNDGFFSLLFSPGITLPFIMEYTANNQLSIGRLGSGGLPISGAFLGLCYLIEFGAFLFPVYMAAQVDYFCERCQEFYKNVEGFSEQSESLQSQLSTAKPGRYDFLSTSNLKLSHLQLTVNPADKPQIVKVNYHYCEKCRQHSIVDISTHTLKYDDKKKTELSNENKLVQGIYIDENTNTLLRQQFAI
jgi:hypothetical protein